MEKRSKGTACRYLIRRVLSPAGDGPCPLWILNDSICHDRSERPFKQPDRLSAGIFFRSHEPRNAGWIMFATGGVARITVHQKCESLLIPETSTWVTGHIFSYHFGHLIPTFTSTLDVCSASCLHLHCNSTDYRGCRAFCGTRKSFKTVLVFHSFTLKPVTLTEPIIAQRRFKMRLSMALGRAISHRSCDTRGQDEDGVAG